MPKYELLIHPSLVAEFGSEVESIGKKLATDARKAGAVKLAIADLATSATLDDLIATHASHNQKLAKWVNSGADNIKRAAQGHAQTDMKHGKHF